MADQSNAAYEDLLEQAFDALTSGETDEGILLCEKARAIKPEGVEVLFLLGLAAYLLNDHGRAITIMEGGHQLAPTCREFADFLSALYSRVGKLSDSLFYGKLAMTLDSDPAIKRFMPTGFDDFEQNMRKASLSSYFIDAAVHFHQRDYHKAIEFCERELAVNPDNVDCKELYGRSLTQVHDYDRAIEVLIETVNEAPEQEANWQSLGDVLLASGRPVEARNIYQRILDFNPQSVEARIHMAQATAFCDDETWGTYPQLMTEISELLAADHQAQKEPIAVPGDGVIHIGCLINEQTVTDNSEILIGLFNELDRERFKVFAYQQYSQPHPATVRLTDAVHHWRRTYDIDDVTLKTIMKNDGVDVLIDTCGLVSGHRQALLASRPAPIQISWLGFPTGGTPASMDVLMSCDATLPVDEHDVPGVKCVSLGDNLFSFPGGALVLAQDIATTPVERNGYITFGAFADMPRLAGSISLWADVLKTIEGAQLILGGVGDQAGFAPLVEAAFEGTGVADCVQLQGEAEGLSERSHLLTEIDILLDSCHVNGSGEICDALWMGVPVVTLMGQRRTSRLGGTTLQAAGFSSWVASTPEEYIEIAKDLARDPQNLSSLRKSIRSQLEASPLMDMGAFVGSMERTLTDLISQG